MFIKQSLLEMDTEKKKKKERESFKHLNASVRLLGINDRAANRF